MASYEYPSAIETKRRSLAEAFARRIMPDIPGESKEERSLDRVALVDINVQLAGNTQHVEKVNRYLRNLCREEAAAAAKQNCSAKDGSLASLDQSWVRAFLA